MGRCYNGDIEGKFWFGLQSSEAPTRFGGIMELSFSFNEFDIEDVKGDMVTLKNPLAKKGEPQAFIYNKKELDQVVKQKADQATGGTNPRAGKVV